MRPIRLRLSENRYEGTTRVCVTFDISQTLSPWQLLDFSQMLHAWADRPTCVALSADASSEWLNEWCEVVAETLGSNIIAVEFVESR